MSQVPEFVLPKGMRLVPREKDDLGCRGCALMYNLSDELHHTDCMDSLGGVTKKYNLESCVKGVSKGRKSRIFVLVPEVSDFCAGAGGGGMSVTLSELKACVRFRLGESPGRGRDREWYFYNKEGKEFVIFSALLAKLTGVRRNTLYARAETCAPDNIERLFSKVNLRHPKRKSRKILLKELESYLNQHGFINYQNFNDELKGSYRAWTWCKWNLPDSQYCFYLAKQPQKVLYLLRRGAWQDLQDHIQRHSQKNNLHHEKKRKKAVTTTKNRRGPKPGTKFKLPVVKSRFGAKLIRSESLMQRDPQKMAVWRWYGGGL